MFWNNQVGKEKEKGQEKTRRTEGERKKGEKRVCVYIERRERLSILLDTLSERQNKENHTSNIDQM